MKIIVDAQKKRGLTLADVLVVVVTLAVLVILLAPILFGREFPAQRINCVNDLKQDGLAFRIWSDDHAHEFLLSVAVTNGGAMEYASRGMVAAVFQVLSNELGTPKLLHCPADMERMAATSFSGQFNNRNVSYFVGPDAGPANPQAILAGDDNLEFGGKSIGSGLRSVSTNAMYFWGRSRHNRNGSILSADGSVQMLRNDELVKRVGQTGLDTNRIVIP